MAVFEMRNARKAFGALEVLKGDSLPDEIVLDLRYNSAYWAQYKGLTATVTQSLNDKMIKSYGDELGTQSYGAVVDLLVNYYA